MCQTCISCATANPGNPAACGQHQGCSLSVPCGPTRYSALFQTAGHVQHLSAFMVFADVIRAAVPSLLWQIVLFVTDPDLSLCRQPSRQAMDRCSTSRRRHLARCAAILLPQSVFAQGDHGDCTAEGITRTDIAYTTLGDTQHVAKRPVQDPSGQYANALCGDWLTWRWLLHRPARACT